MGVRYDPSETVFGTVVYRRYSRGWKQPDAQPAARLGRRRRDAGPADPRPRRRPHPRALQEPRHAASAAPHSMHFHGVRYKPSSDGAFVPGFSGGDGDVKPGRTWTYRLTARPGSVGVWPYHDHSPSMEESIEGGMCGMLSHPRPPRAAARSRVRGRVRRRRADFQGIDGRAFVGNTPVFTRRRRRARAVGRDGDGLRAPHLPRPRPPLARARRRRSTPRPSVRRRASASAGASATPGRGSTTATSRPTWSRA